MFGVNCVGVFRR